jgi:hypothetical protein
MSKESIGKIKLPSFYLNKHWKEGMGNGSLHERLSSRIEEVKRKLPTMSLKEKQELWEVEPYWEVSKLIIESKDWVFPNK